MVQATVVNQRDTPFFNELILGHLEGNPKVQSFAGEKITTENLLAKVAAKKANYKVDRSILASIFQSQIDRFGAHPLQQKNIDFLKEENTFCFTTAHQINLFTGPLYCIYKALHAVKLAEEANAVSSDYNFVPVFWMHTEDHDIDEIDHFYLFGEKQQWDHNYVGASGDLDSNSLGHLIEKITAELGDSEFARNTVELLRKHFLQDRNYGTSAAAFLNELFAEKGLLVLDQHDERLKALATDLFHAEIFDSFVKKGVEESNAALEAHNFPVQAYPRDINLFFLEGSQRYRIEKSKDDSEKWELVGSDRVFTTACFEKELKENSIAFSPNVLCRPLFQETVLPNLAYIGGGGELAYWMQLKSTFQHRGLTYPALQLRNTFVWIDEANQKKMGKLNIDFSKFWQQEDALVKNFIVDNFGEDLQLADEKAKIEAIFEGIIAKMKATDPSLEAAGEGEKKRQLKSLDNLESKMLRAEKRKHQTSSTRLRSVKSSLFPGKSLQERRDNVVEYLAKYGLEFIEDIYQHSTGFKTSFTVLKES